MALLDFLGKDVGGYVQGPELTGDTGRGKSGITYGDILGAALKYGSKPGSSGPAFGGLITQKYGGTGVPGAKQQEDPMEIVGSILPEKKSGSDIGGLLSAALAYFGIGL